MKTFTHYNQPYGTVIFTVERIEKYADLENPEGYLKARADSGCLHLYGKVVEGSTTNRLFQHTSTTDLEGRAYDMYVTPADFERGSKTTVAM